MPTRCKPLKIGSRTCSNPQVVVDKIFIDPFCGDGFYEAPDEFPYYHAADDAREFIGCKADCGQVDTETITINFYDPW